MSTPDPLAFLQEVPPRIRLAMYALGVAESLTDEVARRVLQRYGMSEQSANSFLSLLHCSTFVVPRNSEWYFSREVRTALMNSARAAKEDLGDVHALFLKIGEAGEIQKAGDVIPAYLFTHAGRAYHTGGLGNSPEALKYYARAAETFNSGELWLAGSLAQEQQASGVLPANAIEPAFLQASAKYRDGDSDGAYPSLERIANSTQRNEMVALAMQLAGVIQARRGNMDIALDFLDKAVNLFEELAVQLKLIFALRARAMARRKAKELLPALDDLKHAASLCHGGLKASLLNHSAAIERMLDRNLDAMNDLDEAARIATVRELPSVLNQRGSMRREQGDLRGALVDLDRAVGCCHGEQLALVLNTRAGVLWDLGRLADALNDLEHAVPLAGSATLASVLNRRSAVRRDNGDFFGSLADIDAMIAIPPELRTFIDVAVIRRRAMEVRKAVARLSEASSESDLRQFWFAHFRSAAFRAHKLRLWSRAIEMLSRAIEYASTDDERFKCYLDIGKNFEKTADPARGLLALRHALEIKPDESVALATFARVMDLSGSPIDETEPYFMRAIEADASNLWAKTWFALALSRAGRHKEAIHFAGEAMQGTSNAILTFNLANVLYASPNTDDRQQAVLVAKQAEAEAQSTFKAPTIFLAKLAFGLPVPNKADRD